MADDAEAAYLEFVASNHGRLLRTARLLAAGDAHWAEDLVQTAFTKLYVHWNRVSRTDDARPYADRVLLNTFLDERRRMWRRRESSTAELADAAPAPPPDPDDRLVLLDALGRMPRRQRAAVVLRYFADLDVAAAAGLMGCSEGTIKSQTARGLDKLRDLVGDRELMEGTR
jgi:RNA polymerase sigma-70 factor (sigma-E family)